jgi:hypothetical protein
MKVKREKKNFGSVMNMVTTNHPTEFCFLVVLEYTARVLVLPKVVYSNGSEQKQPFIQWEIVYL